MDTDTKERATFTLRLPRETLDQLRNLTQRGLFDDYEAAIEAAVESLYAANKETPEEEYERKKQALDRSCGVLHLGIDRERWEAAELDRLEYEYLRNTGKR